MQTKALWGKRGWLLTYNHIKLVVIIHSFAYKEKDVFWLIRA